MKSDGGSFSSVSFHVGADWRVDCHTYGDRTPILSIDAGPCSVSFSIADRNADESAVRFARALASEVQAFAAEVERLHAGQPRTDDSTTKAADDAAA